MRKVCVEKPASYGIWIRYSDRSINNATLSVIFPFPFMRKSCFLCYMQLSFRSAGPIFQCLRSVKWNSRYTNRLKSIVLSKT